MFNSSKRCCCLNLKAWKVNAASFLHFTFATEQSCEIISPWAHHKFSKYWLASAIISTTCLSGLTHNNCLIINLLHGHINAKQKQSHSFSYVHTDSFRRSGSIIIVIQIATIWTIQQSLICWNKSDICFVWDVLV